MNRQITEAAGSDSTAESPRENKEESVSPESLKCIGSYTKLQVIEFAKNKSNEAAARNFKVQTKRIREWKGQEAKIRNLIATLGPKAKQMKRLPGCGRKVTAPQVENQLFDFIESEIENNHRITRKILQKKGNEFLEEQKKAGAISEHVQLHFSRGWCTGFMERHSLTLRHTTTTAQKPPSDSVEKIMKFIMYLRSVIGEHQFSWSEIFAADETAIWPDNAGKTSIAKVGAADVTVQTTGHEKFRLTVMLCAKANGGKCAPFLLIPRKKPIAALDQKYGHKIHLVYCGKSWMDNETTKMFLQKCIGAFSFTGKLRLLIWDSFKCHISDDVKKELARLNIKDAVIPAGCTKYIQAPDVCWNHPFKAKFQDFYDEWMSTGKKEYTKGGNMKAPNLELVCEWIYQSWKVVTPYMICESFKICAVTAAPDGSEDEKIYFFKHFSPDKIGDLRDRNKERIESEEIVEVENGTGSDDEMGQDSDDEAGSDSDMSVVFT